MVRTILVEYLIEYHSSVLIKLDRRGRESERQTQIFFFSFFFLWQHNQMLLHQKMYISPPLKQQRVRGRLQKDFLPHKSKIKVIWCPQSSVELLQNISGPQTALLYEMSETIEAHILLLSLVGFSIHITFYLSNAQHIK